MREGEHRLLDADLHKNEFLAVLSHELRNPLAPIRNSLRVLGQAPMDSEPARRARTVIERQTTHMTRLIDDLLDITRISRGKIRLQRRPVELVNLDAALSLCEVLELGGHEVAIAYQGPEGLAKAAELMPDVILCDIGLPGMDGCEVARRVRANPALAKVVLVALSGYALPEDLQRAAAAGFDQHIAKPPSLEQLEALLAGLGQDEPLRSRATTSAPPARS